MLKYLPNNIAKTFIYKLMFLVCLLFSRRVSNFILFLNNYMYKIFYMYSYVEK